MKPVSRRGAVTLTLFVAGLALRCLGLFFKGTHDLDQLVLEWGASVSQNGIGATPIVIYGLLSYLMHGLAFSLAELQPRFWWAPQKILEIVAEVGILFALVSILPPKRRAGVWWLYWLNPFFILSGGWLGFWDGPHTFLGLMAIVVAGKAKDPRGRWFLIGSLLALSALFKPQGLIYFIVPVAFYLTFEALTRREVSNFFSFAFGSLAVFGVASGYIAAAGGDAITVPRSYLIGGIMPNLCNSCTSIWRPVTRVAQWALGQEGPLYDLHTTGPAISIVDHAALILVLSMIAFLAMRVSQAKPSSNAQSLLASTRFIKTLGILALALFAAGLLHMSDPSMHRYLVLGRYSPKYFQVLSAIGVVGLAVTAFSSAIARRAELLAMRSTKQSAVFLNPSSLSDQNIVLALLAFGALIVPQAGTRAHISHTYSALVLLIPLVVADRIRLRAWLLMIGVHLYAYLSTYGIGSATALPTRDVSAFPEAAHRLLTRVNPSSHSALLSAQGAVNQILQRVLPEEPILSILALVQFAVVVYLIRQFFSLRSLGNAQPV